MIVARFTEAWRPLPWFHEGLTLLRFSVFGWAICVRFIAWTEPAKRRRTFYLSRTAGAYRIYGDITTSRWRLYLNVMDWAPGDTRGASIRKSP